ncbi:MAG: phosphomannomutase/phosphoglucomutase [Pseudomonadota bacterium]
MTYPKPKSVLQPNSYAFEMEPLVKPTGFREYDARWWFGHPASDKMPELNLMGVQALGLGLGTMLQRRGISSIVTGHDYRGYSSSIKMALMTGLMGAGMKVHDIGLAVSPMAYFAQFALDVPAVAMVTASHNDNGWTGVKMGAERPVTFGPDEMNELKEIVLGGDFELRDGGGYVFVPDMAERYISDLTTRAPLKRKLKVIAACGNGTAGAFAPKILQKLGCEVVPLDDKLDYNFPRYNPNPEDMEMLHAMAHAVKEHKADLALGFDGDGDRCGVVDNNGQEIFADKIGVMLARDLARQNKNAIFVADVKSTGLFVTDPVLKELGAKTHFWKTGHSYIKRRVAELGALAGFEKSGHFFFNAPVGRGYDDGMVTAIAILDMLERSPDKTMADLYADLPKTWGSPTMAPHCDDEVKYDVVKKVQDIFAAKQKSGETVAGQAIIDVITVNGVRVQVEDGTWGLVRASSNKPELVVVVESPVSETRLKDMFSAVDSVLKTFPEVGAYNQTL